MTKAPNRGVRAFNALRRSKEIVIARATSFLIARGDSLHPVGWGNSEDALIRVLFMLGDKDIAEEFVNSGNSKLEQAGRHWAQIHRYIIKPTYSGGWVT